MRIEKNSQLRLSKNYKRFIRRLQKKIDLFLRSAKVCVLDIFIIKFYSKRHKMSINSFEIFQLILFVEKTKQHNEMNIIKVKTYYELGYRLGPKLGGVY